MAITQGLGEDEETWYLPGVTAANIPEMETATAAARDLTKCIENVDDMGEQRIRGEAGALAIESRLNTHLKYSPQAGNNINQWYSFYGATIHILSASATISISERLPIQVFP